VTTRARGASRRTRSSRDYEQWVVDNLRTAYRSIDEREYRCYCPFHDDEVPSFSININSGQWYCHSEQSGGGIRTLKMLMRDVSAAESVRDAHPTMQHFGRAPSHRHNAAVSKEQHRPERPCW
jgi:hypothetical protein